MHHIVSEKKKKKKSLKSFWFVEVDWCASIKYHAAFVEASSGTVYATYHATEQTDWALWRSLYLGIQEIFSFKKKKNHCFLLILLIYVQAKWCITTFGSSWSTLLFFLYLGSRKLIVMLKLAGGEPFFAVGLNTD